MSRGATVLKNSAGAAGERGAVSDALVVNQSTLFRPAMTIGTVADTSVPFSLQKLGTKDFLAVGKGNGFQIYDTDKLRLSYISPYFNDRVRAVATIGEATLTALSDGIVYIWSKHEELGKLDCRNCSVQKIIPIGGKFVAVVGEKAFGGGGVVLFFDLHAVDDERVDEVETSRIKSGGTNNKSAANKCWKKLHATIDCQADNYGLFEDEQVQRRGKITCVTPMPTWVNKVLLGTDTGELFVFNYSKMKKVGKLTNHFGGGSGDAGGGKAQDAQRNPGIECITPCPTVADTAAIAFADGTISLFNGLTDTFLWKVQQVSSSGGKIHSLSFRSDKGLTACVAGAGGVSSTTAGAGNNSSSSKLADQLVSANDQGFVVWDLNTKLHTHVEAVEDCVKVQFLQGEPFLIAQGRNSLLMYVFDQPDGLPRSLRQRLGNVHPIRTMKFYKEDGNELLAACDGVASKVSTIQQHQNVAFSISGNKGGMGGFVKSDDKLGAIVDMGFSALRHFDWPAVCTAHRDSKTVHLWSAMYQSLVPKKIELRQRNLDATPTALEMTADGNYVLIGYSDGSLHRFAVQSQQHRGEFRELKQKNGSRAHCNAVSCVGVTRELEVVSACSDAADPKLRVWNHKQQSLQHEITLPTGANSFAGPVGSLLAVSLIDGTVVVVDLLSKKVVRHFTAIGSKVLAMAWRRDGRWLLVSSVNNKIHVFDLACSRCIDVLKFSSPVIAIEFSPSNAYMLTTHPKSAKLGAIYCWANKYLFDLDHSAPLLRAEVGAEDCGFQMDLSKKKGNKLLQAAAASRMLKRSRGGGRGENDEDVDGVTAWREVGEEDDSCSIGGEDDATTTNANAQKRAAGGGATALKKRKVEEAAADEGEIASLAKAFVEIDAEAQQRRSLQRGRTNEQGEDLGCELKLSNLPATHIESILHHEQIKERNALSVTQAEAAKKAAPFFLPTFYEGNETKFMSLGGRDDGETDAAEDEDGDSKLSSGDLLAGANIEKDNTSFFLGGAGDANHDAAAAGSASASAEPKTKTASSSSSSSSKLLRANCNAAAASSFIGADMFSSDVQKLLKKKDFDGVLSFLMKQTQAGVHLALSEIGPLAGGTIGEIVEMLGFFEHQLRKRHHADLVQTYLSIFLTKHAGDIQNMTAAVPAAASESARESGSADDEDELVEERNCRRLLDSLALLQKKSWSPLGEKVLRVKTYLQNFTQTQTQW